MDSKYVETLKDPVWSQWVALGTLNLSDVRSAAGIYEMRWAVNGKPQSIDRANGVDRSGLLYIGKATNLKNRLRALYRGIVHKRPIHTAAYTYIWDGFEKKLQLVGVGYRAQSQGRRLSLSLGFSHPIDFEVPEGIEIETPAATEIVVKGYKITDFFEV